MNNVSTIELFIGSNNQTKRVERDILEHILNANHEGYTLYNCKGMWLGQSEDSVGVIISDSKNSIMQTIKELKYKLRQDAIAFHEVTPLEFV